MPRSSCPSSGGSNNLKRLYLLALGMARWTVELELDAWRQRPSLDKFREQLSSMVGGVFLTAGAPGR